MHRCIDVNWDDYRVFLAIGRHSSLTAAARQLGLNQSTVSRRLAGLEKQIGARLFDRGVDGRGLTAAGNELLLTAQILEDEIQRLDSRMRGSAARLTGRLRVTCTDNFANRYLAPHFARFITDYPEVDLDVITRYQHMSLSRRDADVAIRTTTKPPEALVGRRLLRFALAVYGARDMVASLREEPDQSTLSWIGWESEGYNRIMITDHFPSAQIRHRADSLLDMATMAREGLGVAVLGCFAGDPDPGLRRIYADPITDNAMDLWVLTHPDMRNVARVRTFATFISDAIVTDRDLFEGRRPHTP